MDPAMARRNYGHMAPEGPLVGGGMNRPTSQILAQFVAELGKGDALGLMALGPLKTPLVTQGRPTDTNSKQLYGEEDIAALMGFSNVQFGSQLQDIWACFNMSPGKSIDVYRWQIFARMKQWSYDHWIPINTSIYLEGKTIKAIVDLKFNPGEGVAHISSASKGLSIMSCQGRTSAKTKRIRKREEAIAVTENTRQLDKLLQLSKGVTRAPADNFWELKVNVSMFMSLVWVLFGSECDYYKGLQNVYATLELKEVMALKSSFTVEHCCRITWAILDNGQAYFYDVKTTLDFGGPDPPMFPNCISLTSCKMFAMPHSWIAQTFRRSGSTK
jgi:hypothetical protein